MRKGLVAPLFLEEPEPGDAIKIALDAIHPFSIPIEIDDTMKSSIQMVTQAEGWVIDQREGAHGGLAGTC